LNSIVKIAAFVILSLFLTRCGEPVAFVVPKDVIPQDSMVDIMVDIHLVEGGKMGRKFMGDTLLIDDYYHKVFDKYNISKTYFDNSFRFYSSSPKDMDKVYEKVVERLNQMQKKAPKWEENGDSSSTKEMDLSSTKLDSLRAAPQVTQKDSTLNQE
jgi:hypothetical protein